MCVCVCVCVCVLGCLKDNSESQASSLEEWADGDTMDLRRNTGEDLSFWNQWQIHFVFFFKKLIYLF